jgi:CHAD domain-containing protein
MRASVALSVVLQPCLLEVGTAAERFERSRSVKAVHRLRVAIRRAHTALTVVRELAPTKSSTHMNAELHRLQQRIGVVREWDVFIAGALRKSGKASDRRRFRLASARASRRRKKSARRSAADFDGKRFRKLMRHLDAYMALVRDSGAGRTSTAAADTGDSPNDPPVSAFAKEVLLKYYKRFEHDRDKAADLDGLHLHALRIRVKKLRYVAEFFRELYAVRPMQRFLSALTTFQDQLGAMHDSYSAQSKLVELGEKRKGHDVLLACQRKGGASSRLAVAESAISATAGVIGVEPRYSAGPSGAGSHG